MFLIYLATPSKGRMWHKVNFGGSGPFHTHECIIGGIAKNVLVPISILYMGGRLRHQAMNLTLALICEEQVLPREIPSSPPKLSSLIYRQETGHPPHS